MSGTVTVKNVTLGEGMPKICVPLVSTTLAELEAEAAAVKALAPDVVEWRSDYFAEVEDIAAVKAALERIQGILPDIPLIFTFRSARKAERRKFPQTIMFSLIRLLPGAAGLTLLM